MEIEYNIGIDDIVAYNLYYFDHFPNSKKQILQSRIIWGALGTFLIITSLIYLQHYNIVFSVVSIVIGLYGLAITFTMPSESRKKICKQVTKLYSNSKIGALGIHNFSISPENIKSFTDSHESTTRWNIIEQVVLTDQHLFIIFRGSYGAYIIPKKAFNDEAAFYRFVDTAKQYHQASIASTQ